jgi:alcohol dehydrogenase
VPTTAGTGSEVSGGAVVTDVKSGRKAGIAHANLRAQFALVDPVLTYSMSPRTTANTGIDALAQAIAGVIARVRTPVAQGIGLEAIRLAGESLVAAYRDGNDPVARSRMACASLLAGLTMNLSDCGAEHSMGQAIASVREAPHGATVGVVLAETLAREQGVVPELLDRVADALGAPPDTANIGRAVSAVRRILADLDFPVLSDLGIGEADVNQLTDLAMADVYVTLAPRPWTHDEVRAAYRSALHLTARTPTTPPYVA